MSEFMFDKEMIFYDLGAVAIENAVDCANLFQEIEELYEDFPDQIHIFVGSETYGNLW